MPSHLKYFILSLELILIAFLIAFNLNLKPSSPTKSLTAEAAATPPSIDKQVETPSPTVLSASDQPQDTSSPVSISTKKKKYVIAGVGDSMIETMGDSLEYLGKSLRKKYPNTEFILYNYGIGGENVEQGLSRFDAPFSHLNRNYPPLPTLSADILIIGSYSYNPFSPHDRNKHWLTLGQLITKAKVSSNKVYVLAEIAPLKEGFGEGVGGVNWPNDLANTHSAHIVELLENAVGLGKNFNVGLVNVFSASQVNGTKFGKKEYVDTHDGIHPSILGHEFVADQITSTIILP